MEKLPLKFLIVEDNTLALAAINKALKDVLACNIQHALTGNAALDLLKTEKYDLIFMDIGLPDASGKEITHLLRQESQHINKMTPIIGITASKEQQEKQSCIDAGMNAILSKPITHDAIKTILNNFDIPIPEK